MPGRAEEELVLISAIFKVYGTFLRSHLMPGLFIWHYFDSRFVIGVGAFCEQYQWT